MTRETLFLLLAIYATISSATIVNQCNTKQRYPNAEQVKITNCKGPPCLLKQGSRIDVEQRFVPERDAQTITTTVSAQVFGVTLPFFGVSGIEACSRIYNTDGTKASCPITKGKEYIYRNSFPILPIYPRLSTTVHWALTENSENIACFEVPAKIVA